MHKINDGDNKPNLDYKVYWEKQGVDSLCGVHCINSLLQGPFFDEIKLSELALELDAKEADLMKEQGMTSEYIKYLKEESGNVAMDGNYSIQVLQEALSKINLSMVSIETVEKKSDLNDKEGFICNSAAHWIAIRKIKGVWYNLNSLGMRLPEIISDFYLSAFLISVKQCGYQIFSVEGHYPSTDEFSYDHYNPHQAWYPAKRILKYHEKKVKRKGYKPNISGGSDREMEKAMAMSLGKKYEEYASSGEDSDWDNDNKKKEVKPFSGKGVAMAAGVSEEVLFYDKFYLDPEDVEMLTAIRMTLEEQFKKSHKDGGTQVVFKMPNGKKLQRVFGAGDQIHTLYDYIWMEMGGQRKFYLVDFLSKQKLTTLDIDVAVIADPEDNTVIVLVVEA